LKNKEEKPEIEFGNKEKSQLGDDILKLLGERTPNPSEAFVLLQQLSIFLWDQYNIDWHNQPGQVVSEDRKQRYMDYISALIDSALADDNNNTPS
jgi:hypothetical protein